MHNLIGRQIPMILVIALAAMAVAAAAGQSPRELFERARLLEATGQNPAEVIKLYEQVASAAEKTDPALAAVAKERVAFLRHSGRPADRLLFADEAFQPSSVSNNGRIVVGMNGGGAIEARDLQSSSRTVLVEPPAGLSIHFPVVSRDGQFVAYGTIAREGSPRPVALWVVGTAPSSKPRVVAGGPSGPTFLPSAWSPDGKEVLVGHGSAANAGAQGQPIPPRLEWVSIVDGRTRLIRNGNGGSWALSPDGKWIAFTMAPVPARGPLDSNIYVMNADGQGETLVVSMSGSNIGPRWTPDGRHLVFIGDRSGSALWSIAVENGRARGEPILVRSGMQRGLIGVSTDGGLYYSRTAGNEPTSFVIDSGSSTWPVLSAFSGGNPSLSTDGKSLAFLRYIGQRDGAKPRPYELTIRSLETGQERGFPHDAIDRLAPILWRPDGAGVIVPILAEGDNGQAGGAFYSVNIASGLFTRIVPRYSDGQWRSNSAAISRDGRTLFMTVHGEVGTVTQIVARDIETSTERVIQRYPLPGLPATVVQGNRGEVGSRLSLSPDGTLLALVTMEALDRYRLYIVNVDGSGHRALPEFQPAIPSSPPAWLPDSSALVLAGRDTTTTLIQLPVSGQPPVAFGPGLAGLTGRMSFPRIDPRTVVAPTLGRDGSRLAFEATSPRSVELWVFANVMALVNR